LHAFQIFVNNTNIMNQKDSETDRKVRSADRYHTLQRQIREREEMHGHDLDSLVPILQSSSADLRQACQAAVKGASEWFHDFNSGRWAGFFSKLDKSNNEERHATLVAQLVAVQKSLENFRQVERVRLIKPFEKFFDPETGQRLKSVITHKSTETFAARLDQYDTTYARCPLIPSSPRSLFICFVFTYALDAFAERLIKLLTILVDLDGKRPKPRLWAPSGFGNIGRKIMSKREIDKSTVPLAMGTSNDPTKFPSTNSSKESIDGEDTDDELDAPSPRESACLAHRRPILFISS
jgi:hypothetical protein